eukprot:156186_1
MTSKSNKTYKFPNLEVWLDGLGLSDIYSAIKEQEFETLDELIQLNDDDLDELCNEIKSTLKKLNQKLSLKKKGKFKSEIKKEREKYNQRLSSANVPQKLSKVKVYHNNKGYVWKAPAMDKSLLALKDFVEEKWQLNTFEIEYDVDDKKRNVIDDEDEFRKAITSSTEELNIYISTKECPDQALDTIDEGLWKSKSTDCANEFICVCTTRIVEAMKYYQRLDITDNDDKSKVDSLYHDKYEHIVNDFTHLIHEHPNKLDAMYDFATKNLKLKKCNVENCPYTRLYNTNKTGEHQESDNNNKTEEIVKFEYARDILDSIHCYVLHQYDLGFAIHKDTKNKFIQQQMDNILNQDDEIDLCKDATAFISDIIKQVKQKLKKAAKLKEQRKFDLDSEQRRKETETQFRKALCECLEYGNELLEYFSDEEYDSDAIQDDVYFDCNIKEFIKNKRMKQCREEEETFERKIKHDEDGPGDYDGMTQEEADIEKKERARDREEAAKKAVIERTQNMEQRITTDYHTVTDFIRIISGGFFSIGFTYYYWPWHNRQSLDTEAFTLTDFKNVNALQGYKVRELYVEKKYPTLKDEILRNKICRLNVAEFMISATKANKYMSLQATRALKAADRDNELHYGITAERPILLDHVLAIILYTDWSDLCNAFSSTFRKKTAFEPMGAAKDRNAEYANWSRYLREAIQYYGQNRLGVYDDEKEDYVEQLNGPFFCGMSFVMPVAAFNIRLCGPTSTSANIEVAHKFSKSNGIILEFNNVGDHYSDRLRIFNVSWISLYSGEAERLFMGGDIRITLVTVRNVDTKANYKHYLKSLYYFDCMTEGSWMDSKFSSETIKNADYDNLADMINYYVGKDEIKKKRNKKRKKPVPPYVNDSFYSFCYQKKQVVINMDEIYRNFSKLLPLIINKTTNLFKPLLFQLFGNCTRFVLFTTTPDGTAEYKIKREKDDEEKKEDDDRWKAWETLLNLIKCKEAQILNGLSNDRHFTVIIIARGEYDRNHKKKSWLGKDLSAPDLDIIKKFKDNGWECDHQSKIIEDKKRDSLTISKA